MSLVGPLGLPFIKYDINPVNILNNIKNAKTTNIKKAIFATMLFDSKNSLDALLLL
jgi:hypothetical protein